MATRQNLIDTYNANPTLQNRYTQQQYLDLFDFGATPTPTLPVTPTPTPTPTTGIPNIINQNLSGGGRDGPQGGGKFGNLDMDTAKEFNIDGKTVIGYKNLNTGAYQDINQKNIQHLGLGSFGIAPMIARALGIKDVDETQYPGLFDKVSMKALAKNPALAKSFFDRQDVAKQKSIQDAIDAYNRAELAKLEQKRQAEANAKGLTQQVSITAMNKAGNQAPGGGGGGGDRGAAAAAMGGGSRQAKSSGSTRSGRTDGGWGWKEGGSVMSEKEMKKLSETPLYKGFKKMYSVDSSMAKDNPAYSKKYKVFEELYKKGYQKGGLATMFKLKG